MTQVSRSLQHREEHAVRISHCPEHQLIKTDQRGSLCPALTAAAEMGLRSCSDGTAAQCTAKSKSHCDEDTAGVTPRPRQNWCRPSTFVVWPGPRNTSHPSSHLLRLTPASPSASGGQSWCHPEATELAALQVCNCCAQVCSSFPGALDLIRHVGGCAVSLTLLSLQQRLSVHVDVARSRQRGFIRTFSAKPWLPATAARDDCAVDPWATCTGSTQAQQAALPTCSLLQLPCSTAGTPGSGAAPQGCRPRQPPGARGCAPAGSAAACGEPPW